ncbi:hypothetical protein BD309DRAFT_955205 [Dichomitus squalens]|nr:hypothetical protein BD309DRAFT_955205 [Dichomitus squalens]
MSLCSPYPMPYLLQNMCQRALGTASRRHRHSCPVDHPIVRASCARDGCTAHVKSSKSPMGRTATLHQLDGRRTK